MKAVLLILLASCVSVSALANSRFGLKRSESRLSANARVNAEVAQSAEQALHLSFKMKHDRFRSFYSNWRMAERKSSTSTGGDDHHETTVPSVTFSVGLPISADEANANKGAFTSSIASSLGVDASDVDVIFVDSDASFRSQKRSLSAASKKDGGNGGCKAVVSIRTNSPSAAANLADSVSSVVGSGDLAQALQDSHVIPAGTSLTLTSPPTLTTTTVSATGGDHDGDDSAVPSISFNLGVPLSAAEANSNKGPFISSIASSLGVDERDVDVTFVDSDGGASFRSKKHSLSDSSKTKVHDGGHCTAIITITGRENVNNIKIVIADPEKIASAGEQLTQALQDNNILPPGASLEIDLSTPPTITEPSAPAPSSSSNDVSSSDCCEENSDNGVLGCSNNAIAQCVCDADPYCCDVGFGNWDDVCVKDVDFQNCGTCKSS